MSADGPPRRGPDDFDRDFADIVAGIERSRMREPEGGWLNLADSIDAAEPDEPAPDEWKPDPLPPVRWSPVAALGWGCLAYAVAVVLLAALGVAVPEILVHLAIAAFVAALVIGFTRLPRNRDPHDGDGAVV